MDMDGLIITVRMTLNIGKYLCRKKIKPFGKLI